ncbi:T9SS type A sorting domain-containing protein [Jejudonia soesokkakensis]|uniref:T9SS type A sorting domain-containing protein n=1 Tax=Jejudonia soesokkakensis TaxID=1323432 RepID=A0ABW2MQ90_9FLAO
MKKPIYILLFFATIFQTHAQLVSADGEKFLHKEVSTEEAQEMVKATVLSMITPYFDASIKRIIESRQNNINNLNDSPATCFAPDTDPAIIEEFYRNRNTNQNSLALPLDEQNSRFNLLNRWNATATNGGGLGQGDPTTLTWSYVPDGTSIGNNGCQVPDQGTFSSDFIAFFNGIYGPPTIPGDLTTAPWHLIFVDMFNSWSDASGLSFIYEPNDDGVTVALSSNPGISGVRGDMRISGHRIDGNSGVLACNYFPQNGDMIIDTADNFFSNNPGVGTINVLTHEIGHGVGILHVCPVNNTKLMEPFVTLAFQGPQEDDILAVNRNYGDTDETNDIPGTATLLGSNTLPTSYSRTQRSIDDNGDEDYFSFIISQPATLSGTLTPTGTTYLSGVQNSNGSCSPGTPFNALTVADVMFEILATDGITVLASGNANGAGATESVSGVSLPTAGIYYVKVSQQGALVDNVQMYDLGISLTAAGGGDTPPNAVCTNFTAQLDATGNVTILASNVDGGSNDAEGPVTLSVSPNSFTCADLGDNTVTLTVTDTANQTDTCTATVTVEDSVPPVAICQNITAQLDASGNATITGADVDNGSTDNCSIASLSVSPNTFTCSDVGANTVTLTVTDIDGNTATCTSVVIVEDSLDPNANCQNITIQLDASGNASISASDIDDGSSDNCGVASISASQTTFSCADVGVNTVILTVTDVNGNTDTCTSVVTVEDAINPTAVCQDITIQVDSSCSVTITGADVDNGSSDNCSIASLAVSPSSFTCADEGPNAVTLTVTDVNGNISTCTSIVTVERILSVEDITNQLSTIHLFPNPANDVITISNPNSIPLKELIIYDMAGRIVVSRNLSDIVTELNINISSLQSANYFVTIRGVDGQVNKKLTKK